MFGYRLGTSAWYLAETVIKGLTNVVRDTILSGQRNAKSLISLRGLCFVFTKIGFLANNSVQVSGFILILIFCLTSRSKMFSHIGAEPRPPRHLPIL